MADLPRPDDDDAAAVDTDGPDTDDPGTDPDAVDPDATAVRGPDDDDGGPAVPPGPADPDATAVRDPDATAVTTPAVETVEVNESGAEERQPRRRRRGRRVLIGVGVALVLLCGGYAAAAWYLGDKVPQGTSVAGVDLSGMTSSAAADALGTQLADLVTAPIPVTMGEATTSIDPAAAGLELDEAATVEAFTGFTLDPRVVLGHVFGLGEREPVVVTDAAALDAALTTAAAELDVAPVDGVLEIVDAAANVTTEPQDGLSLDIAAAARELPEVWLVGERPFELPSEVTTPAIDDAAITTATDQIVEPLLSGPVTLALNDDQTELSREQLAAAATLEPGTTGLQLVLDGELLAAVVTEAVPSVGETPEDARIVFEDGAPTIIPAVTGTGLDPEQLATAVGDAAIATDPADRVATAELAEAEPEFSTEDAEALGIVEVVGEFSTPYPYDPTRTENLINGAANISGTLVLPGEEFSLIEALGPITAENGYVVSHVVENGFVTDAMGGGLSQISTTTFNAAFEAGMEDIEHKPHSRWFDRYPAGREATLYAPSLDMRWGNNTPYGVLVQAWVDDRVHVRVWSTPHWDVDIVSSNHYNFTSPRTVYNERDNCSPESAGPSGFSIDVTRTVALDGEVDENYSRTYSWTYAPWNRVVCGPPPSADDGEEESAEG